MIARLLQCQPVSHTSLDLCAAEVVALVCFLALEEISCTCNNSMAYNQHIMGGGVIATGDQITTKQVRKEAQQYLSDHRCIVAE
jgi:hypothetical protein